MKLRPEVCCAALAIAALARFSADWSTNWEGIDDGYHAELDGVRTSGPGGCAPQPPFSLHRPLPGVHSWYATEQRR